MFIDLLKIRCRCTSSIYLNHSFYLHFYVSELCLALKQGYSAQQWRSFNGKKSRQRLVNMWNTNTIVLIAMCKSERCRCLERRTHKRIITQTQLNGAFLATSSSLFWLSGLRPLLSPYHGHRQVFWNGKSSEKEPIEWSLSKIRKERDDVVTGECSGAFSS